MLKAGMELSEVKEGKRRSFVVCSSPNGRGIHKCAQYLGFLLEAELIECRLDSKWYLAWEVFGIVRYALSIRSAESIVFANTRVSPLLWLFVDWEKVTVVVHDLMDTNQELEEGKRIEGRKERLMRTVNSWVLERSIKMAGRTIYNSNYTRDAVRSWIGTTSAKTEVVYPPPSFREINLKLDISAGRQRLEEKQVVILVVTGTSRNKAFPDYKVFYEKLQSATVREVKLILYGIDIETIGRSYKEWIESSGGLVQAKYKRGEEELVEDYLSCSFVLSLSNKEGYGMPIADAAGFGICAVGKCIEAFEEIKKRAGNREAIQLGNSIEECVEIAKGLIEGGKIFDNSYCDRLTRLANYRLFCEDNEHTGRVKLKSLCERRGR